jgi:DNA-directed RNA polymerase
MKDLIAEQEIRELRQLSDGIERYYEKADEQGAGDCKAGRSLVKVLMDALIPVIEENVGVLERGEMRPQRVPLAWHYLLNMQADAVAYLTAKAVLTAAAKNTPLIRVAIHLADLIKEDFEFEELEREEPKLAYSMSKKAEKWCRSATRRRIMRTAARVAGVKEVSWNHGDRVKVGTQLVLECVELGVCYIAEMSALSGDKARRFKTVNLTPEWAERLNVRHQGLADQRPANLPMIVPPRPWTNPQDGGYLTPRLRSDLIRGLRHRAYGAAFKDELFSTDMTRVYDALNRVQATPWQVNQQVYDIFVELFKDGAKLGGLPSVEDDPIPECPTSVDRSLAPADMPEKMRDTFHAWKSLARNAHEKNAQRKSHRMAILAKLRIAEEIKDRERVYFPHSLDFRGRLYPLTAELSPQSDDFAKSMLRFADGKPLGESGGYWLCVHIANLFGEDKISFDDRVMWTMMHKQELIDSANDPLDGQRFWSKADDPWCALAACFEFAGWMEQGDDFVSHLPIAMDGSCSGIQHFSAMLRDQEGGAAVNLTCGEKPSDIYTEVLNVVKQKLTASAEPLAKVWLDKVDRKMVKRPCMTYAYSVTSVGIRNQIIEEMRKRGGGDMMPGVTEWEAGMFLAPIVEESIREVVDRAAEAMDWLKGCAKVISKEGLRVSWRTPLGFPVLQPYNVQKGKVFKVWYKGTRIRLTLNVESLEINTRKQTSSVAPNFVHSLDATHLMMVVNRLYEEGVTEHYAMIHDSFGVHACDVNELHYIIRDEFIKLYSEDIVQTTQRNFFLQLPGNRWKELPDEPERGELDLEEVRDADFFFA